MLHPLNEAACADALRKLVHFQQEVLEFACSPTTSVPLKKADVDAFFSKAQDWFWSKLWRYGNPSLGASELNKQLKAVIRFMHANPTERVPALLSLDHDIGWRQDLTDVTFKFWYLAALSDEAQDEVARLMTAFYTDILSKGIPPEIHGGSKEIGVGDFKDAFWKANPELRACPACDRQKPDYVREKDTSDADHFLPKSLYPYLSVHPLNLVPICVECNQRAKSAHDPVRDHSNGALPSTFHPYDTLTGYPRLEVSVVSQTSKAGTLTVKLSEEGALSTPRLKSVEYVWDLENRWSHRLKDAVAEIVTAVQSAGMTHVVPISLGDFKTWLEKVRNSRSAKISKQPNRILQVGYLSYALDTPNELNRLLHKFNAA